MFGYNYLDSALSQNPLEIVAYGSGAKINRCFTTLL